MIGSLRGAEMSSSTVHHCQQGVSVMAAGKEQAGALHLLCLSGFLLLSKTPCPLLLWKVTRSVCQISGRKFKPKACLESERSLGRYPKAHVSAAVRGAIFRCPSLVSL